MKIDKEVSLYLETYKNALTFFNTFVPNYIQPSFISEEDFVKGKTSVIVKDEYEENEKPIHIRYRILPYTMREKTVADEWNEKKHDDEACSKLKQAINDIYGYKSDNRPHPKFVMYNNKGKDAYTTVVWKDGSHTVVKLAAGDQYDEEKAIMFAVMKKMCGDNGCEMGRYFEEFFDHEITHGDE